MKMNTLALIVLNQATCQAMVSVAGLERQGPVSEPDIEHFASWALREGKRAGGGKLAAQQFANDKFHIAKPAPDDKLGLQLHETS